LGHKVIRVTRDSEVIKGHEEFKALRAYKDLREPKV
jgi:hypothetical protein